MKICFITDLHIDSEGINPFEINTRHRFLSVLEEIKKRDYDFMLIGGDLCNKIGDIEVYKWIKKQVDDLNIPYFMIAGNHDTSDMMAKTFEIDQLITNDELFYHISFFDNADMYFLDTSKGSMSEDQYNWLEEKAQKHEDDTMILIMHHPPIPSGSKHMEPRYFFTQSDKFVKFCKRFSHKRFLIFSGHYHVARTVLKDNIILFISPATCIQIDPNSSEFAPDAQKFGFREIFIENNTVTMTNVVYVREENGR